MKKMRKRLYIPLLTLIVLPLAACGGDYPGDTSSNPLPVEDSTYDIQNIRMEDDTVITCLSDDIGYKDAVLTCVEAEEQTVEAIPVAESGFSVKYIKLNERTQLQCLTDDVTAYSAVISCVKQLR